MNDRSRSNELSTEAISLGLKNVYDAQRGQRKSHHVAVRALAFKWQRIIWRCWQSHTSYQEELYEAALRKGGSKLPSLFNQIMVGKNPVKNPAKPLPKSTMKKS